MVPSCHVVDRAAEDQIQKGAYLVPQDTDIGLPTSVKGDGEQNLVFRLKDRNPNRMDRADAFDRIRDQLRPCIFVQKLPTAVERVEDALDTGLVGHRLERFDEAGFDRRKQGQI